MTNTGIVLVCLLIFIPLRQMITTDMQKIYFLVTDLEPLLETQKQIINDLEKIMVERKRQFNFIKDELIRFKEEHKKAQADAISYLKNPINIFTFIKRMSSDFPYIKNIVKEQARLTRNKALMYPTPRDMSEASHMILRLQRVYRLNVTQLADGLLETAYSGDGKTYTEKFLPMTASDCFMVGKIISEQKFYKRGITWLLEALRLYADEPSPGVTEVDIVQAICNSYEKLKNSAKYITWARRLLDMQPKYDEEKIKDLQIMIGIHQIRIDKRKWRKMKDGKNGKKQENKRKNKPCKEEIQRRAFNMLCRGKLMIGHDSKRLKCSYFTGHHPFTKLARFKIEQLFVRPDILLVHNAISSAEILTIKNIALPQLQIIPSPDMTNTSKMYLRMSKGMEFNGLQSASIKQVTLRISDLTGLVATSHPLTVLNYGVGGHYVLHRDSADWMDRDTLTKKTKSMSFKVKKEFIKDMYLHYKMATVVFHLSDVEQGGATVFPSLGLSVFPTKGTALVWFNLLPSGEFDTLMQHGACPVLRGSKWVATKWISGVNQNLKNPCTMENTFRRFEDI